MLRRRRTDDEPAAAAEPTSRSSWEARAAKAEAAKRAREAAERGEPVPAGDGERAPAKPAPARPRWDNMAVIAAMLSLLGMVIVPFVLGPVGIYLGWRARRRIQQATADGQPVGGMRLAQAAMLVGGFAVVLWIVALVVSLTD